jgi:hypothetical protein
LFLLLLSPGSSLGLSLFDLLVRCTIVLYVLRSFSLSDHAICSEQSVEHNARLFQLVNDPVSIFNVCVELVDLLKSFIGCRLQLIPILLDLGQFFL